MWQGDLRHRLRINKVKSDLRKLKNNEILGLLLIHKLAPVQVGQEETEERSKPF